MTPIRRPAIAPIDILGTIKPDGTFIPIVNITRVIWTINAHNNCQIARWIPGPAKAAYNLAVAVPTGLTVS